jgi:hypothetical protein
MKDQNEIGKALTADELADRLDGATPRALADGERPGMARRIFGKLLRPIMFASLLTGLVAHESPALALVGTIDGDNVTGFSGPVSPNDAYGFGYSFGLSGQSLNGMTGDPAIDQAINNGNIDALEGLPASPPDPPASAPPPQDHTFEMNLGRDDLQEAYAQGFNLGLDPDIDDFSIGITADNPGLTGAFDEGFDAAEDGGPDACAACGCGCGCGGGGCGGCGGGGCGGCGGGGCGGGGCG